MRVPTPTLLLGAVPWPDAAPVDLSRRSRSRIPPPAITTPASSAGKNKLVPSITFRLKKSTSDSLGRYPLNVSLRSSLGLCRGAAGDTR
jgi:hypothetical protein